MVRYMENVTMPVTPELVGWLFTPGITGLIGSARGGKTATMFYLLCKYGNNELVRHYQYPMEMEHYLPEGHKIISSLMDLDGEESVVFDDSALWAFSRNFNSNFSKQFVQWLTISGHWPVNVWWTFQNSRLVDVMSMGVIRFTLIQKYSHDLNIDLERPELMEQLELGNTAILNVAAAYDLDIREVAFIHRPFNKVIYTPLSDQWVDELSTPQRTNRFEYWIEQGKEIEI